MQTFLISLIKGFLSVVGLFVSGMYLQKKNMAEQELKGEVEAFKRARDTAKKVSELKDEEIDNTLKLYFRD
jgi:hypothetical protein